ncbi:hypothetical protein [Parasphingorhabdus sp.]|uniref:hypothetical protein n=1 Tax=Parasphingorhabdus sp. TaxID=2709688 RepID=UPI003A92DDDF
MKRLLYSIILRPPVLVVALGAVGLSGCTSLRGAPDPIFPANTAQKVLEAYPIPGTVTKYNEAKTDAAKRAIRDEFLFAYLNAIDAHYYRFRSRLGQDNRELSIGFDTAVLGLSALGTIAKKSADELAAVSGAFIGTQSSIDKNLYFDQTAAALIAAMDAERYKVRTGIIRKIGSDAASYPITSALSDITEYQAAGTIDHAVTIITDEAVKERVTAKSEYDQKVRFACTPEQVRQLGDGKTAKIGDFNFEVANAARAELDAGSGSFAARSALETLAKYYGLSLPEGITEIRSVQDIDRVDMLINNSFGSAFCTMQEVDDLIAKLKAEPSFTNHKSKLP